MRNWKNLSKRRTDHEDKSYEDYRMENRPMKGKVSYFIFMPVVSAFMIAMGWLFSMQYNTKGNAATKEDLVALQTATKADMTAMEIRIQSQLTEIHSVLERKP